MARGTILLLLLTAHSTLRLILASRCYEINARTLPRYKLIQTKVRSTQSIIASRSLIDIEECKNFAASRKALAFNYGFVKNDFRKAKYRPRPICEALRCPDIKNGTSFENSTGFSYYSMYSVNMSNGGSLACVPMAGIFLRSSKSLNYTQAQSFCHKLNGTLAHVASEKRTDGLATFLKNDMTLFVGLSNTGDGRFWKNDFGEPLSCFDYRAWGEDEPSNSRGCVGVTRVNGLTPHVSWVVLSCQSSYPFICEIMPYIDRSSSRSNRTKYYF